MLAPEDVDFAIADLLKGDSLGAHQALLPGGKDFPGLSLTRLHTTPALKQRVVHKYQRINEVSPRVKQSCPYEIVKDLPALLRGRPDDWLLSCDCRNAFWSVQLHKDADHFLSFHFALPLTVAASPTPTAVCAQCPCSWARIGCTRALSATRLLIDPVPTCPLVTPTAHSSGPSL